MPQFQLTEEQQNMINGYYQSGINYAEDLAYEHNEETEIDNETLQRNLNKIKMGFYAGNILKKILPKQQISIEDFCFIAFLDGYLDYIRRAIIAIN